LGIETRAVALAAKSTAEPATDIDIALQRLIGSDQMGTLFKVLAIGPRAAAPPAGFLPQEADIN
jgi:SAM-dependent MidA family methyltransferase